MANDDKKSKDADDIVDRVTGVSDMTDRVIERADGNDVTVSTKPAKKD